MPFDPKEGRALVERARKQNDIYSRHAMLEWFDLHKRQILWRLGSGDEVITLSQLDELHADLDRLGTVELFGTRYIGLSIDYTNAEVAAWPAMKAQLVNKLRAEEVAAVVFWDSNRVCWSSGYGQQAVYDCYRKGFWMTRRNAAYIEAIERKAKSAKGKAST
jgi:hypothetical protein